MLISNYKGTKGNVTQENVFLSYRELQLSLYIYSIWNFAPAPSLLFPELDGEKDQIHQISNGHQGQPLVATKQNCDWTKKRRQPRRWLRIHSFKHQTSELISSFHTISLHRASTYRKSGNYLVTFFLFFAGSYWSLRVTVWWNHCKWLLNGKGRNSCWRT